MRSKTRFAAPWVWYGCRWYRKKRLNPTCFAALANENCSSIRLLSSHTLVPYNGVRRVEVGFIPKLAVLETMSSMVCRPPSGLEIFGRKIPVPVQGPARPMQASKPWFNDG